MELKPDERNVLEDLQHDKQLQQMARFRPLSKAQAEYVDEWVSYYACQYDCINMTDTRVYEILDAINQDDYFEFEGEEPEPEAWENPMNTYRENRREYLLSYGPETSFEAGEEN